MKRRFNVRKNDKRYFSKTADMTHRFNVNSSNMMRGGIRL